MGAYAMPQPGQNPLLTPAVIAAAQAAAQQGAAASPLLGPASPTSAPSAPSAPATLPAPSAPSRPMPGISPAGDDAPKLTKMDMGAGPPSLPAPTMPGVQPSHLLTDRDELNRKIDTGSGISQISGKIEHMLPNHPVLGKILGGAAQGLATLGDVGLRTVAPAVDIALPGTSLHHLADLHQGQRQVAQDEANEQKEAETAQQRTQAANLQSEIQQRPLLTAAQIDRENAITEHEKAGTEHERAETQSMGNPSFEVHDTEQGPLLVNKKDGSAQHLTVDGAPVGPKVKLTYQTVDAADGPHVYGVDEQGKKVVDLGKHYERPVAVATGAAQERAGKNDILKAYAPAQDSAERFNVMTESYEKAVKDHDQQAMLNLLANHLGMTMGLQKGARLTKDIINEAKQSTPWLQGMQAKFDKDGYLSGVVLNPRQMQQMVALGQSRYAEDAKKSRATAQYLGAEDDGPNRTPGAATINYYLGLTNGDPARAKALAAQDGWTVP